MAAGIEIYRADGSLQFAATDFLGRVMGSVRTWAASGSYLYTGPSPERLWTAFTGGITGCPDITVSGNVIYWNYNYATYTAPSDGWIVFGLN